MAKRGNKGPQIPTDTLNATESRFKDIQDAASDDLTQMSRVDLLRSNSVKAIQSKLQAKGITPRSAKKLATTAKQGRSISMESMEVAQGFDAMAALKMERILNGNDLLDIRYLLSGAHLAQAVGRICFKGGGFATGFLVAPGIMMTNHHVFAKPSHTQGATLEFGYREIDSTGKRSKPTVVKFDSKKLFFADKKHDVAVVALGAKKSGDIDVGALPYCPLRPVSDEPLAGSRVNIIQHPAGEPKQVALRDNKVIGVVDGKFLHYVADTKRGSSGSPTFDEEWNLIALHHSGVPERDSEGNFLLIDGTIWKSSADNDKVSWIANEAILVNSLISLLESQSFSGQEKDLIDAMLAVGRSAAPASDRSIDPGAVTNPQPVAGEGSSVGQVQVAVAGQQSIAPDGVSIQVPLTITVRIGDVQSADSNQPSIDDVGIEALTIDRDYSNREGYDPGFLEEELPLPKLTPQQKMQAAVNQQAKPGDDPLELPYTHFSVVMNGKRRLAFYTAVNIDGGQTQRVRRSSEGKARWTTDPRIKDSEQADNTYYADKFLRPKGNPFDRGHLVRRLDPSWGTEATAKRGIADSFHYTNSAQQFNKFNQGGKEGPEGLWLALEDFVLKNADSSDVKVSVFTGPVFTTNDRKIEPVDPDTGNAFPPLQIPSAFWKTVAWVDEDEELQSASFLLSQADMIKDITVEKTFDFTQRKLFQVPIAKIVEVTNFDFGPLMPDDLTTESFNDSLVELSSADDIVLD